MSQMTTEIFIKYKGIEDVKVDVKYRVNALRATRYEEAEQEPEIIKVTLAQDVSEPEFAGKRGDPIDIDGDAQEAIYEQLIP